MKNDKLKLTDLINDENFIAKMNMAFSDLRADFELSMDIDKKKISELKDVHIDNRNYLQDLTSYSKNSSGVISGLRGTGKTHLFLIARDNINDDILNNKTLCIYLNVKRLSIPQNANQELFNRIFSVYFYNEMTSQLYNLLADKSIVQKIFDLFDKNSNNFKKSIDSALEKLSYFNTIVYHGNEEFFNLDKGSISQEDFNKELISLKNKISAGLKINNASVESGINLNTLSEITTKLSQNNTYQRYLNVETVRKQLLEIIQILKLKSLTIYVDEWEKLYYNQLNQEYLSFYIDKIIDTPIYAWIGIVPYRGSLYNLDNGADLQHYINLDESLVFETSEDDKKICKAYFQQFINNRLKKCFDKDDCYSYKLLFNQDKNLDLLILASMGNSRDFGTMFLNCWSEFKAYRTNKLMQGRPYQYINKNMIVKSIKNNGEKKLSNIRDNSDTLKVWRELEKYCIGKKSSHFVIEETNENMECLGEGEYSELIYHRLLHFRKGHIPPKDTSVVNKLSLYALNYTSIYDLHSKDRIINFITEHKTIHDRIRRYIYDPSIIINDIRIRKGEIFPCISCSEKINIGSMKGAWENNSCPFCGGKIRNI